MADTKIKEEKKATRKPRTTKKAKVEETKLAEAQFQISDVISWDDAKCAEMDSKVHFPVKVVRDILKKSVASDQNYSILKAILFKGLLKGYAIQCPKCKERTEILVADLDRENEVTCTKCGIKYKQLPNIIGISTYPDNEEVK